MIGICRRFRSLCLSLRRPVLKGIAGGDGMEFGLTRRFAWIAQGLVGVMALGWLIAPLHFLGSEHHWCAEHEQFEHDETTGEVASADAALLSRVASLVSASAADPDHDACQVLGHLTRPRLVLTTGNSSLPPTSVVHACVALKTQHLYTSDILLSAAPKQGPPA